MSWRRTLLGGGAVLGAAATWNRVAASEARPLVNRLGGEEGEFRWRGHSVSYTVHGEGPAILLVHGIYVGAWSFEWRRTVTALAKSHRVYAIDLLGFGRSARPAIRYSSRLFLALLDDFATAVVRDPCCLMASSLSAAYAIALGARDPARYSSLVLIQPTGLVRLNKRPGLGGAFARLTVEVPLIGTSIFNAVATRPSIRHYLEQVYARNEEVTDELVSIYYDAAHQPGARHALSAFFSGHLNIDVRAPLRRLTQPTMLVWGERAQISPLEEARGFLAIKAGLEVAIVDPAGDLPHDEESDVVNLLVERFLERAPAPSGLRATG